MKVNLIEIVNVLVVISLLSVLSRWRDNITLLLVLFTYGTLHFAFSAFAITENESVNLLAALHNEGGGILAKLSAAVLVGVVFVLLSRRAYFGFMLGQGSEKKLTFYILFVMGAILLGYFLNIRDGDWLQFKNIISIEAMLTFLLVGYLGASRVDTLDAEILHLWIFLGLVILGVTDSISIYEVLYHKSWAGTLESSGEMVYRASSILFNPNLLSFWAALIYIGCAYGVHVLKENQKVMFWGMILASIAIYLSGSRSIGFLLLGILFIPAILLNKSFHWLSLVVFPMTMLTIYAVAKYITAQFISSADGWREIVLLGERFEAAPVYLINYIFGFVGIPIEVMQSIEGRFIGESRDSGWLVLYQDAGLFGLVAVIFSCFALISWGWQAYDAQKTPANAYALAAVFYCLLSALVMRFQIFPNWLFLSIVFVSCFISWRQTASFARN